jgi:formylglycine-generating enzyme required for sulfatase activity
MTARPIPHPSPDLLRALAANHLGEAEARAVLAHLSTCRECWLMMTTLSGDGRLRAAETVPGGATIGPAPAAGAAEDVPPELRDHAEFEVLRKLGGGGMGVVYLARDRLTHRVEVLKVVNPSLATQPGLAERFLREIRAAVQLLHPNIVTAYGALQIDRLLVLKMEYVPGDDLKTVVEKGGPLPVVRACSYAQQVALGLHYAFGKGMVHRDIKPGNLILARDGQKHVVKILDFGLVKAMAAPGGAADQLTGTGLGLGTPAYMAPEQAKDAARADVRADIYSLGCTLYFLLTGRPPFAGQSPYDLWEAHRSKKAAPLSEVRKDVPADLANVVAKMLAKAPAGRYQEPAEVAQALEPFRTAVMKSVPAAPKPATIPAALVEVHKPGDRTAEPRPRVKPEAVRRAGAARRPANRPIGGTRAVLLGVAGLLLVGGCGGAVYWAVSRSHGDPVHAVAPGTEGGPGAPPTPKATPPENGTGRNPAPRSTDKDGPKREGDVVARVKEASGIELVPIPAGSFYMGSPNDDKDALDDERPQHKVTISQPFYLGKYKVTRGQFRRFVEATHHVTEAEKAKDGNTWKDTGFPQTDEHPVVLVSWNDADAYCRWLAEKTGATVRLPYEAEWEYSCRAVRDAIKPTTRYYYFGDDVSQLGNYAWYEKNSGEGTHPCGEKLANDFGLYDMHGNAWEWCADGERTYKGEDVSDPKGRTDGKLRVNRGGAWSYEARLCRSAARHEDEPSFRREHLGFRVLVAR